MDNQFSIHYSKAKAFFHPRKAKRLLQTLGDREEGRIKRKSKTLPNLKHKCFILLPLINLSITNSNLSITNSKPIMVLEV